MSTVPCKRGDSRVSTLLFVSGELPYDASRHKIWRLLGLGCWKPRTTHKHTHYRPIVVMHRLVVLNNLVDTKKPRKIAIYWARNHALYSNMMIALVSSGLCGDGCSRRYTGYFSEMNETFSSKDLVVSAHDGDTEMHYRRHCCRYRTL